MSFEVKLKQKSEPIHWSWIGSGNIDSISNYYIYIFDLYLDHIIINTEQNFDYNLNGIFFKELGLRDPDYNLKINNTTLGNCLSEIIIKSRVEMVKLRLLQQDLILHSVID